MLVVCIPVRRRLHHHRPALRTLMLALRRRSSLRQRLTRHNRLHRSSRTGSVIGSPTLSSGLLRESVPAAGDRMTCLPSLRRRLWRFRAVVRRDASNASIGIQDRAAIAGRLRVEVLRRTRSTIAERRRCPQILQALSPQAILSRSVSERRDPPLQTRHLLAQIVRPRRRSLYPQRIMPIILPRAVPRRSRIAMRRFVFSQGLQIRVRGPFGMQGAHRCFQASRNSDYFVDSASTIRRLLSPVSSHFASCCGFY